MLNYQKQFFFQKETIIELLFLEHLTGLYLRYKQFEELKNMIKKLLRKIE